MKKITTATAIALMEEARYHTKMNWLMAKALVEGKVTSEVLRWAEMQYQVQKDMFEAKSELKKGKEKV